MNKSLYQIMKMKINSISKKSLQIMTYPTTKPPINHNSLNNNKIFPIKNPTNHPVIIDKLNPTVLLACPIFLNNNNNKVVLEVYNNLVM
mmetsp:Transcript_8000/g.1100  ORF Transcript_8000/g.1100 Transcript_8000/m.1100 type:complete len:89 (-) Transcript_8000:205-471(-)